MSDSMGIEVQGLEEFGRRVGLAGADLARVSRIAIRRTGEKLQTIGRDRASRLGRAPYAPTLGRSIQMEVASEGLVALVGSVASTAPDIERGRQPGEMPRVGLILGWMNREGMVTQAAAAAGAVQLIASRKVSSRGRQSARARSIIAAQKHVAWKIAIAIKAHGTKPLPFLSPAVREAGADVERYFREAAATFLAQLAVKR